MLATTNEVENEISLGLTHPANENVSNNKRSRKRNVTWFNPPFSVNVKTKVGNYFLNLIGKQFSPRHKFGKLFNRYTIKVSYSWMPYIRAETHKHNKNALEKAQQKHLDTQLCSCTNKKQCPLNGECLTDSIAYQANITANIPGYKEKIFLGVSETTLKFAIVTRKIVYKTTSYKRYGIIQDVLKGKTTKRNTQNKVKNIKEMPRL